MAMNIAYYTALVEQFKLAMALLNAVKPILIDLFQFAEDHMPQSSGKDKLTYVMTCLRGMLPNDETTAKIDVYWGTFTSLVSGFATLQKSIGAVKPASA